MDPKKRFRLFAYALLGVVSLVALALLADEGAPPWGTLLVFAVLLVYTGHRAVEVAPDAELSPAFMILMASVVVFAHYDSTFAPLVLGALVTVRFDLLREPSFRVQACFNAANLGLAMLAASEVFRLAPSDAFLVGLVYALLAAVVMTASTVLGLAVAFAVEGTPKSAPDLWREFAPGSVQSLPFAIVGYAIAVLYLALGPAVMLLVVVPILIAREMFAAYIRVKESHEETVGMLIRALEAKDRYTSGHSERVATYARYMGEQLHFMPYRLERLRFAALMHDIGKLVVPNHLLNKPSRLTAEEFAQIRIHEKVSVQMLSHVDFLRPIAAAGHSDATRFDPDDVDHPIEPYIVMIADAYDAMTSTRAYRKALSQEVAFQELRDKAGVQFHPACVEALITAIERRGEKHGAGYEIHAEFQNAPDLGLGSAGLGDLLPSDSGS